MSLFYSSMEEIEEELGRAEGEGVAPADANVAAPNGEGEGSPKKKRTRETYAEVWNDYNKGPVRPDGSYDATCKYCGKIYKMGNQKSTTSMKNHLKSCKKAPKDKRQKVDPLQKYLVTGQDKGKTIILLLSQIIAYNKFAFV